MKQLSCSRFLGSQDMYSKDEACYTYFGIAPQEIGLAKPVPQEISEGRPMLEGEVHEFKY